MKRIPQLLSAMVYQNIVVIIAVGVIRGFFGNYGWWYNEEILRLVNPVYHTLLPVLIAYTGGKIVGGQRGAVVASIVTYGVTLSSSVPAILGAMIIGPVTGWIIKKIDQLVKNKLPTVGYELLVGNVLAGLVAIMLTIISFLYIGDVLSYGAEIAMDVMETVIRSGWLPLVAGIIEPAKVLFLNNIINFGVLSPLGIQQVNEAGKSIFFLLEANPGPGLGVLVAYWLKTQAEQRKGAKLATTIHFFGGIHEVYFAYVLMNPRLILSLILGGVVGIYSFQLFDVGLVAVSSPGSIFLIIALAAKADMLFVLLGVIFSALTSFCTSLLLLKNVSDSPTVKDNQETIIKFYPMEKGKELLKKNASDESVESGSSEASSLLNFASDSTIYFVCEAGIGSSAMGAAMLRKKLEQADLKLAVENAAVDDIPDYADLVICHHKLLSTVKQKFPDLACYPLTTFTDMKVYDQLIDELKKNVS